MQLQSQLLDWLCFGLKSLFAVYEFSKQNITETENKILQHKYKIHIFYLSIQ